jgi:hypothetical protein
VRQLEDSVTRDVVSLPSDILSYVAEKLAIRNANICKKRDQVVWRVCSIGAAIAETSGR